MVVHSPCGSASVEELRGEVRKVIDSSGFVGAKQLQSFLIYVSEAVFRGRDTIEQSEIARDVLGRGDDFNPIDDPSVRKIASLLRKRLQRYYETDGASSGVIISLPLRSYLPQFDLRSPPEPAAPQAETTHLPAESLPVRLPQRHRLGVALAALLAGTALGYGTHFLLSRPPHQDGEFHLQTAAGDLISNNLEEAKKSMLVGPSIGEHDEVVVRMRFRPSQPFHQAGLLLFDDADNYIEMRRIFRGRCFLEFASEASGRYQKTDAQVRYDTEGQTLAPLWLAIRRNGDNYQAFSSSDGTHWFAFGEARTVRRPLQHPRVALFAFQGKTQATRAEAIFDHLSIGPGLHDWAPDTPLETVFGDWRTDQACPAATSLVPDGAGVRFTGLSLARPCTGEIVRPVPSGDWSFSTRVDFVPSEGLLTGLQVRGAKGRFRVVRWNINGSTVTAEWIHQEQANVADFPGSPPVILRVSCRNGILQGSFSRDDIEYTDLGLRVPLAALGSGAVIGYQLGMNKWNTSTAPPPLVYWLRHEVISLSTFR